VELWKGKCKTLRQAISENQQNEESVVKSRETSRNGLEKLPTPRLVARETPNSLSEHHHAPLQRLGTSHHLTTATDSSQTLVADKSEGIKLYDSSAYAHHVSLLRLHKPSEAAASFKHDNHRPYNGFETEKDPSDPSRRIFGQQHHFQVPGSSQASDTVSRALGSFESVKRRTQIALSQDIAFRSGCHEAGAGTRQEKRHHLDHRKCEIEVGDRSLDVGDPGPDGRAETSARTNDVTGSHHHDTVPGKPAPPLRARHLPRPNLPGKGNHVRSGSHSGQRSAPNFESTGGNRRHALLFGVWTRRWITTISSRRNSTRYKRGPERMKRTQAVGRAQGLGNDRATVVAPYPYRQDTGPTSSYNISAERGSARPSRLVSPVSRIRRATFSSSQSRRVRALPLQLSRIDK
jgi:hypothetical protein